MERQMNNKAIRGFVVGSCMLMPCVAEAVLGDINRDGVVGFDDFFILSDNFGKRGSPEQIDTVYVRPPTNTPQHWTIVARR
jgi:hypothetical protein